MPVSGDFPSTQGKFDREEGVLDLHDISVDYGVGPDKGHLLEALRYFPQEIRVSIYEKIIGEEE